MPPPPFPAPTNFVLSTLVHGVSGPVERVAFPTDVPGNDYVAERRKRDQMQGQWPGSRACLRALAALAAGAASMLAAVPPEPAEA